MVQLCRQYPFAYCIRRSFNEISFVEEFDAVWACASIIHVPPEKLQEAIFHLYNSVKPNGIIYFSIKVKNRDETPDEVLEDRYFYYYDPKEVRKMVQDNFALELIEEWENPGKNQLILLNGLIFFTVNYDFSR